MREIICIQYKSGMYTYIPKSSEKALDFIICNHQWIEDIYIVQLDEEWEDHFADEEKTTSVKDEA